MSTLEQQLGRLRAFATFTYPFACVPFLYPWFVGHGLDAASYGEVLSAYYLAMFVAEVPTGVLADRVGPQRMLVLGPLLLAAGFATLVMAPHYTGFLVGEVLLGLGHSVLSGPPSAVLYEHLRAHGQEHRYLAEESRMHARRLHGTGVSFLLGGALVQFGGNGPGAAAGSGATAAIVLTAALCTIAAVIGIGVAATPHHRRGTPAVAFLGQALGELRKVPVRWLCAYWVVLFALLRFPFHDYQPYLLAAGELEPLFADAAVVGVLFAALNLLAAPMSAKVPQLKDRFGRRALFWAMPLLLCASMAVLAGERALAADGLGARWMCWVGVAMFFVQQVPFAMHWPLLFEFANHRIGPHARTTVLSLLSLVARAAYAGVNVLLFRLQAERGLATAMLVAAGGGLVATFAVLRLRPRGVLRGEDRIA